MGIKRIYFIILLSIFLSSLGGAGGGFLFAQTGTISGKIKQDDGQPAIGARIFVYTADGESILGDANTHDDNDNEGKFITGQIPVGVYAVHIKYEGYKRVVITGVPVEDKKSTDINMKIEPIDPHEPEEQTYSYSTLFPKVAQPPPQKTEEKKKRK